MVFKNYRIQHCEYLCHKWCLFGLATIEKLENNTIWMWFAFTNFWGTIWKWLHHRHSYEKLYSTKSFFTTTLELKDDWRHWMYGLQKTEDSLKGIDQFHKNNKNLHCKHWTKIVWNGASKVWSLSLLVEGTLCGVSYFSIRTAVKCKREPPECGVQCLK